MRSIARKMAAAFHRRKQDKDVEATPRTKGKLAGGSPSTRKGADGLQSRRTEMASPEPSRVKSKTSKLNDAAFESVACQLGVAIKALVSEEDANVLLEPVLTGIFRTLKNVVDRHAKEHRNAPSDAARNKRIALLFEKNLSEALRSDRISTEALVKVKRALEAMLDPGTSARFEPHALLTPFKTAVDAALEVRGPSSAKAPAQEDAPSFRTPRMEESERLTSPRRRTPREDEETLDSSSDSGTGGSDVDSSSHGSDSDRQGTPSTQTPPRAQEVVIPMGMTSAMLQDVQSGISRMSLPIAPEDLKRVFATMDAVVSRPTNGDFSGELQTLQDVEDFAIQTSISQAADVQIALQNALQAASDEPDMSKKLGLLLDAVQLATRATGRSTGIADEIEELNQAIETFCSKGMAKARVASLVDAEQTLFLLAYAYPNDLRIRKLRIEVLAQLVNRAMALMQKKHGLELHELTESNVLKLKRATLVKLQKRAGDLLRLAQSFTEAADQEGLKAFTASLQRVEKQATDGLDLFQKATANAMKASIATPGAKVRKPMDAVDDVSDIFGLSTGAFAELETRLNSLKPRTPEDDVAALKQAEQALKDAIRLVDLQEFEHLGDTLQSVSMQLTSVVMHRPEASENAPDKVQADQQLSQNLCAALLRDVMPSLTESELLAAWHFPRREKEARTTELLIDQIQFSARVEVLRRGGLGNWQEWSHKQTADLYKFATELMAYGTKNSTPRGVVVRTQLAPKKLKALAAELKARVEQSALSAIPPPSRNPEEGEAVKVARKTKEGRSVKAAGLMVGKADIGAIAGMDMGQLKKLDQAVELLKARDMQAPNLQAIAPVVQGRLQYENLLWQAGEATDLPEKIRAWSGCAKLLTDFEMEFGTGVLQGGRLIDSIAPHAEVLEEDYSRDVLVSRLLTMVKHRALRRAVDDLGVELGVVWDKEGLTPPSRSKLLEIEKLCSQFLEWIDRRPYAELDNGEMVAEMGIVETQVRTALDVLQKASTKMARSHVDGTEDALGTS